MRSKITITLGLTAIITIGAPIVIQKALTTPHTKHAQPGLPTQLLLIHTKSGPIRLNVEVASTPEQQEVGLMFRKSVPLHGGMMFPIRPVRDVSFWMKNTVIPLDMLFIRANGAIARVIAAKPLDHTVDRANEPIAAVLEIGSGRAKALGIEEHDKVQWQGLPIG